MKFDGNWVKSSSPFKGRTGGVRPRAKDIFNLEKSKSKRKELRLNTTRPEQCLWSELKGRQMQRYKFRRQFGVGKYIVDFYAAELKLAIEVDGDSHAGKNEEGYDRMRTEYLNLLGITCVRFANHEIMRNLSGVVMAIEEEILNIRAGWLNPS